jgi:hypothetical protein
MPNFSKATGFASTLSLGIIAIVLSSMPVAADAIDGKWCHKDGRNLSINGSKIVTPGGTNLKGNYERHGFDYVAPKGDRSPGAKITMNMEGEYKMRRQVGKKAVENWTRCRPVS